jgi:hypothetical protein
MEWARMPVRPASLIDVDQPKTQPTEALRVAEVVERDSLA